MTAQEECRGEFPVEVTEKDYVQAAMIASRRYGPLRSAPAVLIVGALCLVLGLGAYFWFSSLRLVALLFCILGLLPAAVFFLAEPAAVRRAARKDFKTYRELMGGARVYIYPDHADTVTDLLKLTDPYALMAYCVETPELLVFLKDRERVLILPKRCLPADQRDAVLDFLRLTFIRKRRVMRSWFM